jgi:hypothetical protein
MYDYCLDGRTNYPADREAAEQALSAFPTLPLYAQQNRAFLHRAVRLLAERAGVDQFLDLGAGLPTQPNLHEIVPGFDARPLCVFGLLRSVMWHRARWRQRWGDCHSLT